MYSLMVEQLRRRTDRRSNVVRLFKYTASGEIFYNEIVKSECGEPECSQKSKAGNTDYCGNF